MELPSPPSSLSSSWISIQDISGLIVNVSLIVILLFISALISGAEVAFFSLSKKDLEQLKAEKGKGRSIVNLKKTPEKLLATILIANNFINISIVLIFSMLMKNHIIFSDYLLFGWISIKVIVEIALATFLILFFGEILPKIYANSYNIWFSKFVVYLLIPLNYIFTPLSKPMQYTVKVLKKNILKTPKNSFHISKLSQVLELTSEKDTSKQEQKILEGIADFGNTETKQIVKSRIDIFAVNEDMSFRELIDAIIKNTYSRIPVYKENLDNITGILYAKDLLEHLDKKDFDWKSLKRDVYFVPENKKLDNLLKEFQEKKIHLSVVVDEYGGISGIVTLEDIIEEIIGDISDEFDQADLVYSKISDYEYIFEGKTLLRDFYKIIQLKDFFSFEEAKGNSETLAGFVLEIFGKFPKKGDKISYENYSFVVEVIDEKRIKQLKITLPQEK